jgi:Tfp pilus assembly protein PilV
MIRRHSSRKRERGVALVVALFALLLLSAIGAGMLSMSNLETSINYNYRASQVAFFAARGGLEEARVRIMEGGDIAPPTALLGKDGGAIYILNPDDDDKIDPTDNTTVFFDTELCHQNSVDGLAAEPAGVPCEKVPEGTAWYTTVDSLSPFTGTSAALPFKWVRINLKKNNSLAPFCVNGDCSIDADVQVCWDGTRQTLLPVGSADCNVAIGPAPLNQPMRPCYIMTALALTPTGARRMVQMEACPDPPFKTNAAVDSQDHVALTGQLGINAFDGCNCLMSAVNVPGSDCTCTKITKVKGVPTCSLYACNQVGKTCDKTKWAIYSSESVDDPNASQTILSGLDNPSTTANEGIAENQEWPYDIEALISKYKDYSGVVNVTEAPYNYVCTGTPPSCGTQTSQTFGTIPSPFPPLDSSNPIGAVPQLTYVPGDLKITSSSKGAGILVVDGDLEINGGLEFFGLIVVKGVISFTGGGADKTNIVGAVLAGQQSVDNTELGGSATIQFDSCALEDNTAPQPPTLVRFTELTY